MRSIVYDVNGGNVQCRRWRIEDFSERGYQPQGMPTYYLAKLCRKLHENERNWTIGGRIPSGILLSVYNVGSGSLVPPLDLPVVGCWQWETWAVVD